MKRLIIFICFTLCIPTPAIAGVANIKHMSRNSDGTFDVICVDRTLETVNSKAILDNSVCSKTVTYQPPSASKLVICTGSPSWSYRITRISDNQNIGDFSDKLSLKECQQAVKASTSELVCTGSPSWSYYITRISNNQRLGDFSNRFSLEECLQAVKASSPEVANQQ